MERTGVGAVTSSFIWRPNAEISPSCPRCGSSNTKFCYYNNYSLTQPRYFCKGCRRYWTKGGSLRNVPVGGGCRKSRRPKSSSSSSSSSSKISLTTSPNTSNGGSPSIDLALVYANFLNPNPDDSKTSDHHDHDHDHDHDLDHQMLNSTSHDHDDDHQMLNTTSTEFQILPQTSLFSGGPAMGVSVGSTWSMDINDHDHHQNVEDCGYNGLPPFPGEDLLSLDQSNVWSDALLIDVNPVQSVREPVVHFGEESNESTNILFGSWSPFDFSADG